MGSSDNSIIRFRELVRLREVVNWLISTRLVFSLIGQHTAIVELAVPVLFFGLRSRFACCDVPVSWHHMTGAAELAGFAALWLFLIHFF